MSSDTLYRLQYSPPAHSFFNQTKPPKKKKERDTETEQEFSKNREIYHMNMQNTTWVFFHFCVLGCNSQNEKGRLRRRFTVFFQWAREKKRRER